MEIINNLKNVLLNSEKPSEHFENLRNEKQLDEFFPELKSLINLPQNEQYHKEGDVWTHTMLVLDEAVKRRNMVKRPFGFMLSALCHDFGKAVTTEKINGVIHAYGHEIEGLPLVKSFLERFSFEQEIIDYVLNMTEFHMMPNIMAEARSKTKNTNKLFDSAVEPFDLIQLAVCDGLGKIPQKNDSEEFLMMRFSKFTEIMTRPYVMEEDLINAGITEQLDEVLAHAHKMRLAGFDKDNSLRQTIAYARKVLKIK